MTIKLNYQFIDVKQVNQTSRTLFHLFHLSVSVSVYTDDAAQEISQLIHL